MWYRNSFLLLVEGSVVLAWVGGCRLGESPDDFSKGTGEPKEAGPQGGFGGSGASNDSIRCEKTPTGCEPFGGHGERLFGCCDGDLRWWCEPVEGIWTLRSEDCGQKGLNCGYDAKEAMLRCVSGAGGAGGATGGASGATGGAGGATGGSGGSTIYGVPGPSCEGMTGKECQGKNCCSSILVPGGVFPMGRSENGSDACSVGMQYCKTDEQPEHDVTVSDFYLDEFEVTVGRFRKFVDQFDGTLPSDGAGEHPLIPGTGWHSTWNHFMPSSKADWQSHLKCDPVYPTWRDTKGDTEQHPINCVSWFDAFAFCVWDGGRLPTEAEWEYAAVGGIDNRLYPWGSVEPSPQLAVFDCQYDGKTGCSFADIAKVGSKPAGAGRWGHKDLAGNMVEWVLDVYDEGWYSAEGNKCNNCASFSEGESSVCRGGCWSYVEPSWLRGAVRLSFSSVHGLFPVGFRCAR